MKCSRFLNSLAALLLKAQISLVHQGGALQSVIGTFLAQVVMRYPSQLVVHERKYGTQGLLIAGLQLRQQLVNGVGWKLRQTFPQPGQQVHLRARPS